MLATYGHMRLSGIFLQGSGTLLPVKSPVVSKRWHPSECKECGARAEDGIHISATGLCGPCGERIELANLAQLRAHSGPHFNYWRRRCLAAFGVVVDTDE